MANAVETLSRVRGSTIHDLYTADDDKQADVNGRGDALVAMSLPAQTELVRLGGSWQVMTSTAVAPVVALPTTAALFSLWNGETGANAKTYVIDSVFALVIVSAAAATPLTMLVMNQLLKNASKPAAAALTIGSLNGKPYGGNAITAINLTGLTNDGWFPVGESSEGVASQIGMCHDVPLAGLEQVRPGGIFHVSVMANTVTTITVQIGVRWHEVFQANP